MKESSVHGQKSPLSPLGWVAVAGMGALLGFFIWFAFWGWDFPDVSVNEEGMASLLAGAVLSVLLGAGLMALLFWSHRKGYDR